MKLFNKNPDIRHSSLILKEIIIIGILQYDE